MSYVRKEIIGDATLYLGDCLPAMLDMPDNAFELAIVDPPYGIGEALVKGGGGGGWSGMVKSGADRWDIVPHQEYFEQLFRVSKNQVIWGGNYFNLPPCKKPICWDKIRPNQKYASEWEYAWTSFVGRAQKFDFCNNGGFLLPEPRIHPTQKPPQLYKWLLKNFASPGDRILDTHHGSGSNAIACLEMGFSITAYEIDEDYYTASIARIKEAQKQLRLFE